MSSVHPGTYVPAAILRRRQDKQIRNFKYLYEDPRNQSDKLRQMREKFRIGDGKSIEKSSIGTHSHGLSHFNDSASLMFETGQAFFNPANNAFSGHKMQQLSDQKQLPPLQLQSKTILSMQSGATGNANHNNTGAVMEQNFQMQKAANSNMAGITPQKAVEKMISRDPKGNLGIVPVEQLHLPTTEIRS